MNIATLRLDIISKLEKIVSEWNIENSFFVPPPEHLTPSMKVIWSLMARKEFGGFSQIESDAVRDILAEVAGEIPDMSVKTMKIKDFPPYLILVNLSNEDVGKIGYAVMRRPLSVSLTDVDGNTYNPPTLKTINFRLPTYEDIELLVNRVPDSFLLSVFFQLYKFNVDDAIKVFIENAAKLSLTRPIRKKMTKQEQALWDIFEEEDTSNSVRRILFKMKKYDISKFPRTEYITTVPYACWIKVREVSRLHVEQTKWEDGQWRAANSLDWDDVEFPDEDEVANLIRSENAPPLYAYPTSFLLEILEDFHGH